MTSTACEHTYIFQSERDLLRIWDMIDWGRMNNGEKSASALAEYILKQAREYQLRGIHHGSARIHHE